jgi:hypothetical protein
VTLLPEAAADPTVRGSGGPCQHLVCRRGERRRHLRLLVENERLRDNRTRPLALCIGRLRHDRRCSLSGKYKYPL